MCVVELRSGSDVSTSISYTGCDKHLKTYRSIIHFVLFIFTCVEVHRRNRDRQVQHVLEALRRTGLDSNPNDAKLIARHLRSTNRHASNLYGQQLPLQELQGNPAALRELPGDLPYLPEMAGDRPVPIEMPTRDV